MAKKKSRTGTGSASNKTRLEQQKQRRAKYVQGWQQLGIDSSIISRLDLRNKNPDRISKADLSKIKSESRKVKTARTKQQRAKERESFLISEGYKKSDIKKSWLTSDKLLYKGIGRTNPNEIFHATNYLALAFTGVNGSTAIINTGQYREYTFSEIKQMIKERIAEAEEDPDTSGDQFRCVFEMFQGTEEECEVQLDGFSKRGYNLSIKKLTDRKYYRLVNRNDWTMREYAEMVLCVLEQCHNKDVPMLVDQFRFFIDENELPFDEIFN